MATFSKASKLCLCGLRGVWATSTFLLFRKMIGHMLSVWRHYPQNRSNQQVKFKQSYVPKSNLGTREENVNMHIEIVNVVNFVAGNDFKTSSLRDDVIAPNNDFDQEDSLEETRSLIDDSQQVSLVHNVEQI